MHVGKTIGGRASVAVLGSMLLATLATACGTSADAGPAQRPREPAPAEAALLDRAEEKLMQRCMEREGFRYWPARAATPDELKDFPYVVDDLAWARRHGYGSDLRRKAEAEGKHDRNAAYAKGLSPARQQDYAAARSGDGSKALEMTAPNGQDIGQSSTGCLAEAERKLYGDFKEWFRVGVITGNLPDHSDDLRRHPRYRGAVKEWSACMTAKGHPYKSPERLQRALAKRAEGSSPREARRTEVRLATAEARCARSTPLSAAVRSLTRHYDNVVREKYGEDIDAKRRLQREALTRAREITGSRP